MIRLNELERYKHPDQWKHYGRCDVCRRKPYCHTQCTANRKLAAVALREYLRKTQLGRMKAAMQEAMRNQAGEEVHENDAG